MTALEHMMKKSEQIEKIIGYTFQNRSLLLLAFVHRSYVNEHRDVHEHNERLEFLGDSVLELLVSEYLYRTLPNTPEGELSNIRAKLVEASACIAYIQKLDLEKFLLLGKGERMNSGRGRESILADLFEALIGSIYLDGGLDAASHFLFKNFGEEIDATLRTPQKNSKAQLQDVCQKHFQQAPQYVVLEEVGPDHDKMFQIGVYINDCEIGQGKGSSKKEAQQAAATSALTLLQNRSLKHS